MLTLTRTVTQYFKMAEAIGPWTIHRGAEEDAKREKCIEERDIKTDLADYVKTEFPKLTGQDDSFISIPAELETILVSDEGDEAELAVFHKFKNALIQIPGLSITIFNGRSYVGKRVGSNILIPREIDLSFLPTRRSTRC